MHLDRGRGSCPLPERGPGQAADCSPGRLWPRGAVQWETDLSPAGPWGLITALEGGRGYVRLQPAWPLQFQVGARKLFERNVVLAGTWSSSSSAGAPSLLGLPCLLPPWVPHSLPFHCGCGDGTQGLLQVLRKLILKQVPHKLLRSQDPLPSDSGSALGHPTYHAPAWP